MENEKAARSPIIGITVDLEGEYLRLRHHYPPAIRNAGGTPVLIPNTNDPHAVAEIIDGLLIPGGGDIDPSYYSESSIFSEDEQATHKTVSSERTGFEIALLRAIMELGKPALGICYGMQLMNVALGGSLYQDIGIQFGGTIDHGKGNHGILGQGDLLRGEFFVNSSHHQAVKQLGSGLSAIASSDDGLVEAIQLNGYPFVIGIQWHPERSDDGLSRKLFSSFVQSAHADK
jgi:putative glutamine amidotransferase